MKEYIVKINEFFKHFQSAGSEYESLIGQATSYLKTDISALFLKDIPRIVLIMR